MLINEMKTKYMIIGTSQNVSKLNNEVKQLYVNSIAIQQFTESKLY